MRTLVYAAAIALILFVLAPANANTLQPSPQALAGHWEGSAVKDGRAFRLTLDFAPDIDATTAYIDFVDLPLDGIPFAFRSCSEGAISERRCFERHPENGPVTRLDGDVRGSIYQGRFDGAGAKGATFRLERKSLTANILRQEDVSFRNGDATLAGTIIFPAGKGPFPAVVISHGSDPETRESAGYRGQGVLLARHGLAVLIYDKRGVGRSTGDYTIAGLDDLARDTLAGVALLRARSDIRADRIGVAGHSQGGWIAPLAATISSDVAFVFATSSSALGPMAQSLYHNANEMRAAGFSEADIKRAQALRDRMYQRARTGAVDDKFLADLEAASKEPWFAASKLPYPYPPSLDPGTRRLLLFEPLPVWRQVRVPVLAIWGGADIYLPAQQSRDRIADALKAAGNAHATLLVLPGLSHSLYQERPASASWDFPRGDPAYERTLTAWIDKTLLAREAAR